MFCLVYYTEIGVLPEENSLCGNNSHWKYWRKKASTVRTNATSISTKSIRIEKQRKIFHLRFPKSNPLNLWACLHFRAVWHNYSMLSPVALLGTSNTLLTVWFPWVLLRSVVCKSMGTRPYRRASLVPTLWDRRGADGWFGGSVWAADQFCPWQS